MRKILLTLPILLISCAVQTKTYDDFRSECIAKGFKRTDSMQEACIKSEMEIAAIYEAIDELDSRNRSRAIGAAIGQGFVAASPAARPSVTCDTTNFGTLQTTTCR